MQKQSRVVRPSNNRAGASSKLKNNLNYKADLKPKSKTSQSLYSVQPVPPLKNNSKYIDTSQNT